ncbi:MAG: polysaccharide lyase family 8 super-sandwich domain-containing protein [Pseudobdellovibrionaceae bacterium]
MKACLLFLISFFIGLAFAQADDIDTLSSRMKADYIATVSTASANTYLTSQLSDGSWSNIDYATPTDWNFWPAVEHLNRVWTMAVAYHKPGTSLYQNSAVRLAVIRGYDSWLQKRLTHPNWWQTIINAPRLITRILLLMEPDLTAAQINSGIELSNNADYNSTFYVGQNRVWIAGIFIHINILRAKHNLTEVKRALTAIQGTVALSDLEGIRQDFGFHQHGRQLYNSGYGQEFVMDISYWMKKISGLSIAFTSTTVNNFSSLLLDGSQWMIRRNQWDMASAGRGFSRPQAQVVKPGFITALDAMISLATPRKAEFQNFKSHIQGGNDAALIGNKNFWLSNYHAHRRGGYFVSVKTCSVLVDCHEYGNGENAQGYYLTQGAMTINKDGLEYSDIWPVWDFARVPGVTSPYKTTIPLPPTWGTKSSVTFAGGVSTGMYGASGFQLNWDGVTGKKAWFFFRDEVVALGAGITSSSAYTINTTLNQVYKRGNVTIGNSDADPGAVATSGQRVLNSPKWIHHDNVGYVFPHPRGVNFKDALQTGSWRKINSAGSTTSISKWIFSLWLDHGVKPTNASYDYIIVPGASLATMQNYNSTSVRVIENSTSRQAVRNDSLKAAGVIFYVPGKITIHPTLSLEVNQKVAVFVNEVVSPMQISVASPESKAMTVSVILTGSVNKTLSFVLPGGRMAGSSVTQTVTSTGTTTPPSSGITSNTTWKNTSFTAQTKAFEAKFTMTPNGAAIDALTGLSYGAASNFAKIAAVVRFNPQGLMDARNGSAYNASSSLRYIAGKAYAIRMRVDLATHRYSVYVTPSGGTEVLLANNFAFRTEQAAVTQLNNVVHYAATGSHTVSNFTVTALP